MQTACLYNSLVPRSRSTRDPAVGYMREVIEVTLVWCRLEKTIHLLKVSDPGFYGIASPARCCLSLEWSKVGLA